MRFDTKAIARLLKSSYKGGGVKIARTEYKLQDTFFLAGGGWQLMVPKASCPGEVIGLICGWLGDMPLIGQTVWVYKGCGLDNCGLQDPFWEPYLAGSYCTGAKPLPLYTSSLRLFKGMDGRVAAFEQTACAVVGAGLNLGGLDEDAAQWLDEETDAAFWADNQAGSLTAEVYAAAKNYKAWEESEQ